MPWMYAPRRRPLAGTTTSIGGLPFAASLWASALYAQRIVSGVAPWSIVPGFAIVGTRFLAAASFLKKSSPGWALSSEPPFASAAAKTALYAWLDTRGSPASATLFLKSAPRRSFQSFGLVVTMVLLISNVRMLK